MYDSDWMPERPDAGFAHTAVGVHAAPYEATPDAGLDPVHLESGAKDPSDPLQDAVDVRERFRYNSEHPASTDPVSHENVVGAAEAGDTI